MPIFSLTLSAFEPGVSMDGNHKQKLEDLELFQNHVVDSFF
jgi:hypothetical protein